MFFSIRSCLIILLSILQIHEVYPYGIPTSYVTKNIAWARKTIYSHLPKNRANFENWILKPIAKSLDKVNPDISDAYLLGLNAVLSSLLPFPLSIAADIALDLIELQIDSMQYRNNRSIAISRSIDTESITRNTNSTYEIDHQNIDIIQHLEEIEGMTELEKWILKPIIKSLSKMPSVKAQIYLSIISSVLNQILPLPVNVIAITVLDILKANIRFRKRQKNRSTINPQNKNSDQSSNKKFDRLPNSTDYNKWKENIDKNNQNNQNIKKKSKWKVVIKCYHEFCKLFATDDDIDKPVKSSDTSSTSIDTKYEEYPMPAAYPRIQNNMQNHDEKNNTRIMTEVTTRSIDTSIEQYSKTSIADTTKMRSINLNTQQPKKTQNPKNYSSAKTKKKKNKTWKKIVKCYDNFCELLDDEIESNKNQPKIRNINDQSASTVEENKDSVVKKMKKKKKTWEKVVKCYDNVCKFLDFPSVEDKPVPTKSKKIKSISNIDENADQSVNTTTKDNNPIADHSEFMDSKSVTKTKVMDNKSKKSLPPENLSSPKSAGNRIIRANNNNKSDKSNRGWKSLKQFGQKMYKLPMNLFKYLSKI